MPAANKPKRKKARKFPTISKALLLKAARFGPAWNFNRQLDDKKIAAIPDRRYRIVMTIPHFHAWMQPREEHRRLVVELPGAFACVDVPLAFFERVVKQAFAA